MLVAKNIDRVKKGRPELYREFEQAGIVGEDVKKVKMDRGKVAG